MALTDQLPASGSDDYYQDSFRWTIEASIPKLKTSTNTTKQIVTALQGKVYNGNLYGLLTELGVPFYLLWVVMRLNDFHSSSDFTSDTTSLLIPSASELERLRLSWRTSQKVTA